MAPMHQSCGQVICKSGSNFGKTTRVCRRRSLASRQPVRIGGEVVCDCDRERLSD